MRENDCFIACLQSLDSKRPGPVRPGQHWAVTLPQCSKLMHMAITIYLGSGYILITSRIAIKAELAKRESQLVV